MRVRALARWVVVFFFFLVLVFSLGGHVAGEESSGKTGWNIMVEKAADVRG
jgi:hypothetical protein